MKKTRRLIIALFSLFIISALLFSFLSVADGDTPVVYRNDTKYTITEYPPELRDGALYMPVSFFVGMSGIQYEFNAKNNSFYLRNESTGRFFSFSFDAAGIVVDNSFVNVSFPIIHSTVYLPLDYCADILSLKVEKTSSDGVKRVRLSDRSARLSFEELIELYDPTDPDKPPVITPEDPDNPIDQTTDRTIYITIDCYPDTEVSRMINMLRDWGEKATFFFTKESITDAPEAVLRADARGHGIAVTALDAPSDLSEMEEALDEVNRTLYSVLGYASRLCRFPKGRAIDADTEKKLSEMGYIVWDFTEEMNVEGKSAFTVAKEIYDATFKKDVTVVRLTSHENNVKALTQLLSFVANDEHITARVIDPTVSEYNFSQTEVNDGNEKENSDS